MSAIVQRFVDALHACDATGDCAGLVACCTDDATATAVGLEQAFVGRDGIAAFWRRYRDAFARVETTFHRVTEAGPLAVLEWSSDATLPGGRPLRYDGFTILDLADGRIAAVRTSYDTAAFVAVAV